MTISHVEKITEFNDYTLSKLLTIILRKDWNIGREVHLTKHAKRCLYLSVCIKDGFIC